MLRPGALAIIALMLTTSASAAGPQYHFMSAAGLPAEFTVTIDEPGEYRLIFRLQQQTPDLRLEIGDCDYGFFGTYMTIGFGGNHIPMDCDFQAGEHAATVTTTGIARGSVTIHRL